MRRRILICSYAAICFDCKDTKSNRRTRKIACKRLNFNYFKDRSSHFDGTVVIEDISIKDCWGDCIYIGGKSDSVIINNYRLDNGRRQGVSITSANIVKINYSVITNINCHAPETGLDIEPNEGQYVNNVMIDSVSIVNCVGGFLTYGYENKARVGTIIVNNCNIVGCKKIPLRFYGCKEVEMIKCSVEVAPGSEGIQKVNIVSFKNSGLIF